MSPEKALEAALDIVGGPAKLAREIGSVSRQSVSQWKTCPPSRVLDVEQAVLRAVNMLKNFPTRHDLRPDLYPREERKSRGR